VRDLEEVMIRVTAEYGFNAGRIEGLTGAWVVAERIGAIGVRFSAGLPAMGSRSTWRPTSTFSG